MIRIPAVRDGRAGRSGSGESPARRMRPARSSKARPDVALPTGSRVAAAGRHARSLFVLFLPPFTGGEAGPLDVTRHLEAIPRIAVLAARSPVASAPLVGAPLLSVAFRLRLFTLRPVAPFGFGSAWSIALRRPVAPFGFGAAGSI